MSFIITVQLALRSLMRNKVRTGLTMLGIFIGIASVIAMVAIGQGASSMIQSQINAMGRNLLMVLPGAASSGGFSWGGGSTQTLMPGDGDAIAKEVPSVNGVAPIERTKGQIVYGGQNWVPVSMIGTDVGFLDVRDWELEDGNFFTKQDVLSATKTCVLGLTVVENLFQGESPVGTVIRIKNMPFRVLGVLSRKGTNAMGMDQDDTVLVPWTTAKRVLGRSVFNNVDQILVTAASSAAMAEVSQGITALLRERHHIREGEDSDFRILSMTEMTKAVTQTSQVMTVLLAIVASISLIVGGIGIMNIMLVSVVERTREIGLRMAIGARARDILMQFLVEAMVLSTVAGVLGMLLGAGTANIISKTLHWPILLSPASIVIAFTFSCAVGIFFGFYPAVKAAKLDPIEALRYE